MIHNFEDGFSSPRENRNKLLNFDGKAFLAAVADALKTAPDKNISGQLFRPRQRHAKNVTAENLNSHDQRHGDQTDHKKKFFEVFIQPVKYSLHKRHTSVKFITEQ